MKRKNQEDKPVYSTKIIHRAKILDLVIKKKIIQSQAAKELKLRSDRQIRKLLKKYRKGNYSLRTFSLLREVQIHQGVLRNKSLTTSRHYLRI